MIVFPNCKINLGLNIVNRRPDGYHNLETVFYPVNGLFDSMEVTKSDVSINAYTLQQYGNSIDCEPEKNLVVKAYQLFIKQFNSLPSIDIHLIKHIPSGAGLGGGSSDAAFMLKLLNDMFEKHLSTKQLEDLAAQLGADCPFFIHNKPTYARGIGDVSNILPHQPSESIIDIIKSPIHEWRHYLTNDFEASIFPQHPEIASIKLQLYEKGAEYASMSGSGSSVFGLFAPGNNLPKLQISKDCFTYYGVLA